jgi:uncharacterized protein involved in oxidation of intracellular sulfur
MAKREGMQVRVFLIGDAVACAKRGQRVPAGNYSLGAMLGMLAQNHGEVGICGSCLDARGVTNADLAQGTRRTSMEERAIWSGEWADKVIVF